MLIGGFLMVTGQFLGVSGMDDSGFFSESEVFETKSPVNYRIPNALTTNSGSVFLFCNDRHGGVQDHIDTQWVVFSKAEDGVHFSEPQYILKQEGWQYVMGAALYDAVNDKIMLIYRSKIYLQEEKKRYEELPENEREPIGDCILESSDQGLTWTKRRISIPTTKSYPFGTPHTHGASTGVQLKNGEHAGRLCVAAYTATADTGDVSVMSKSAWSCILYSDDFGYTWKVSNSMPAGTGESTLCELSDGTVYLNCRTHYGDNTRYIGISTDGGATISETYQDSSLVQPGEIGVKGSVISFENPDQKGKWITLFSCLREPTGVRRNLCIWISYDNGKTWADMAVIDKGYAAYSDMTFNPVTKYITLLYEHGKQNPYSGGIKQVTFDLTWLMKHKEPNVPLRINTVSDSVYAEIVSDSKVAHFDASSLNAYANGELLNAWEDSTGNGNTAGKPVVGKQPTVKANAIGGYSAALFETDGLSLQTNEITSINRDCSYFIVFKSYGKSLEKTSFLLGNSHIYGLSTLLRTKNGCFATKINTSSDVYVNSNTFLDSNYHILAVSWSGSRENDSVLTQFMDGSRADVKFAVGESVKSNRESSGIITIGRDFHGEIAEVILYNKALSDDEVAKTGLALAQKFGLTWSGVTATNANSTPQDTTDSQPEDGDKTPGESQENPTAPEPEKKRKSMSAPLVTALAIGVPCLIAGGVGLSLMHNRKKKKTTGGIK